MRILIIEPDEYYHRQFQDNLSEIAELRLLRRLEEALRALAEEKFDLIITELLLADGHAYDFLPKVKNIPVAVYTNLDHLEDVQQSLNLGVMSYFVKGRDTINDVKRLALTLNT